MRHAGWVGLLGLLAGSGPAAGAAASHPFGWEEMFAMIRLSDPQPSPDGAWILFGRAQYDVEADKKNADLGLISIDGKTVRRLTNDPAADVNGRWLPDGAAILFLSDRAGLAQIFRLPLAGGEPEKVTDLPVEIDGFELSPEGKRVLFWARVFPECKDLECTAKRLKERQEGKVKAMLFDTLLVRHWDSWSDGRRNHLFVMGLEERKPVDLMAGMDQDAPTRPFGGGEEVAWSPDGKSVAFTSKPSKAEAWTTDTEIYEVPADAGRKPKSLTSGNPASDSSPVFSPDGSKLAYLAMERPGYESDRYRIVLLDLRSDRRTVLANEWDRSPHELLWSADGKTLYTTATEKGRRKLYAVDAQTGAVRALVEEGVNSSVRLAKGGSLLFLHERMTLPKEIALYDAKTQKMARVGSINGERLAHVRFGTAEEFWFKNDRWSQRGWILKPPDFREGQSYPLAFLIHGGPQSSWEDRFHYRWNPHFYAGAGYVTIAIDPRGSTGYGQAFTDAIRGNWGPGPYADLMAGLKEALRKYPFVDRKRMCALGASYGGYMVNWIAGEAHPFRCLVNHDGDFDTASSYFNTEELWFPEWEMTGPPWEKAEVYERNSPMRRVAKWKTPMLVVHGARDYRVADTEGISTFTALQRRGIPSKLLYFPDENHWVLKAQNSRLWHKTVLEWLDRWTETKRN